MDINELINKIKEKKELSGLDNSIVQEVIFHFLKSSEILKKMKKAEIKELIKLSRAELRNYSGQFYSEKYSLTEIMEFLKENKIEIIEKIHSSTKERTDFYPILSDIVKNLNISLILDIGCGLNPIIFLNYYKENVKYFATDINKDYLSLINYFFEKNKINGETFFYDLRKIKSDLPKVDICFIFKVFDVIEKKGHKLAENIIKNIDSKYFLVSFSTKTLSGRPMNHPQRGWIERLFSRLGFSFKIYKSNNEIFYLAEKTTQKQSLPQ